MNELISPCGRAAQIAAIAALSVLTLWFGMLSRRSVHDGPTSIIHLELAPTVEAADGFLQQWKRQYPNDWQRRLQAAQTWDTWLICAYAPLFTLLCWMAAGHFAARFPQLAGAGRALAAAQLLAGALDFLENASINKAIAKGSAETPWPLIATTASSIKWLLLATFTVYALAAAVHWFLARR